jgi:hypothetical protein
MAKTSDPYAPRFTPEERSATIRYMEAAKWLRLALRLSWAKTAHFECAFLRDASGRYATVVRKDRSGFALRDLTGHVLASGPTLADVLPMIAEDEPFAAEPRQRKLKPSTRLTQSERRRIVRKANEGKPLGLLDRVQFTTFGDAEIASIQDRTGEMLLTVQRSRRGYDTYDGRGRMVRRGDTLAEVLLGA